MDAVMGKILVVNLSTGEIRDEAISKNIYENFLSGKGLGAWYLFNNVPAGADPLGPDNVLGFTSGALTGTGALMCGRWTVVAKSPLTGGWGDSNCGGSLSPAIKQCGYDAIFFHGISEKPVYLFLDGKIAELRDAAPYWGLDAVEAEERLIKDNWKKKKPRVAVIGQAGEKLSFMAGISNDFGRIAARSGLGAVMGSKKLKAVVLTGAKPIPVANFDEVKVLSKKLGEPLKKINMPEFVPGSVYALGGHVLAKSGVMLGIDGILLSLLFKKWGTASNTTMGITWGDAPLKNWGGSVKDFKHKDYKNFDPDKLVDMESHKYHCYSCGMGCGAVLDISKLTKGEFSETHKPEYETLQAFGGLCLNNNLESVIYINEMMNRAAMDTISAGNSVAMAIECYENGIITKEDTGGLELNWRNSDAIIQFCKMMINREGIGDVFADGTRVAAKKLGCGSEKYAMNVGGSEPGMHDCRGDPLLGLHFAAEPAPGKHTIGMGLAYSAASLSDFVDWAPPEKLHRKSTEYGVNKEIALKAVAMSQYSMITDGVGGCLYGEMFGVHHWNPAKYMNAAAGWNKSNQEYMDIGKRIQTVRQLFNVKHGIDLPNVKLPDRLSGKPALKEGPLKGKTLNNEENVSAYWKLYGWDKKSGIPTKETLHQLGLDTLLDEGDKYGC